MKTSRLRSRRRAPLLAAALLSLPLFLAGADKKPAAPATPAAPKTHVLFMGADLSVQRDKKIYRVEDIEGSDLKIRVDRQATLVPTRGAPVNLQVNAGLKLAAVSVQLDQLKTGPAYTFENDPIRKLQEAANNQMVLAHTGELAQGQMSQALSTQSAAQRSVDSGLSRDPAAAQRDLDNANNAVRASQQQMASLATLYSGDLANTGAGVRRMQGAEGDFDAVEVSFKATSPVELDHPYMVILFKFHDPQQKPGTNGLLIHAQAIDPINSTPRYVRVLKGGMPIGFSMVECAVHIYNHGEEVATNVSDKRVELTRDETQLYIVMEHIGGHKGATLPAAVVSGSLPPETRQRLSPEQLKRRLYVKVSKDGLPAGAFSDEACTLPVDEAVTTAALGEVFFTPALQQGKAVDGVARVRLGDI